MREKNQRNQNQSLRILAVAILLVPLRLAGGQDNAGQTEKEISAAGDGAALNRERAGLVGGELRQAEEKYLAALASCLNCSERPAILGRHRLLRLDRVGSKQSVTPQTDIKYAQGHTNWKLLLPLSPS